MDGPSAALHKPVDRHRRRYLSFLFSKISILPLVIFRIAFGLMMLAGTIRFAASGWIHELYGAPDFHFTYYGLGWIRPLPPLGMAALFGLMGLCALGVALGLRYRLSILGFFLLFTYVELIDKSYYLNHYYLVSILSFLLIFLPTERNFSIDAWRNPTLHVTTVPAWTIWALRLQVGLVYFYAGIAKLKTDWLLHALPLKLWLPANVNFPLIGSLFDTEWMAYLMSWGGAAFDLSIPFLLLWRRTRPLAFLLVVVFHSMTWLLFPIGIFPWLMIASALIFFEWGRASGRCEYVATWFRRPKFYPLLPSHFMPSRVKRGKEQIWEEQIWDAQSCQIPPINSEPVSVPSRIWGGPGWGKNRAIPILTLFFLIQLLLPLRHHLYPGNVLWTEEGFRFAWHVMVYEKTGYAIFHITEPQSDRTITVFPSDILTPKQQEQMAIQPDMIVQFARELARRYADQMGVAPETLQVRAEAYVSLNGRSSQLLVDPLVDLTEVDLMKVWSGLGPKAWIVD